MLKYILLLPVLLAISMPAFSKTQKSVSAFDVCQQKAISTLDIQQCNEQQIKLLRGKIETVLSQLYAYDFISDEYKSAVKDGQEHWLKYAQASSLVLCPSKEPSDCGTIIRIKSGLNFIKKLEDRLKEVRILKNDARQYKPATVK